MPESNSKWLTFLVYFLLSVLTITTGWSMVGLADLKDNLPKEFVRLERYKCDIDKLEKQIEELRSSMDSKLNKLDNKLDRIIWRGNGK